jgi:hypothetical protein
MTDGTQDTGENGSERGGRRRAAWERPALRRLEANDAESGTHTGSDQNNMS